MSKQTEKSSRKRTKIEPNLFYEILADPINNFIHTFEQKALKTTSAKEFCDAITAEMKEAMKKEPLLSRNAARSKNKGDLAPSDIDHKRLQTKYNKTF